MKKVVKHGVLEKFIYELTEFECPYCKCAFETDEFEFSTVGMLYDENVIHTIATECPECKQTSFKYI